jgi:hypothetical protein
MGLGGLADCCSVLLSFLYSAPLITLYTVHSLYLVHYVLQVWYCSECHVVFSACVTKLTIKEGIGPWRTSHSAVQAISGLEVFSDCRSILLLFHLQL